MPPSLALFGPAGPDPESALILAALGVPASPPADAPLATVLTAARVAALRPGDDDEWWRGDETLLTHATGCRLEVAALARAVAAAADAGASAAPLLASLAAAVDALAGREHGTMQACPPDSVEGRLSAWASARGADASFCGGHDAATGLRGAVATAPVRPGDCVASIPASLLLTPASAAATELGTALAALPVGDDDRFILFCLVDAADPESERAPLWASLRPMLEAGGPRTGLTASPAEAALLDGTAAAPTLARARAHAAACARAAAPALTACRTTFGRAVPGLEAALTEEGYVRMLALLHSHAVDVVEEGASPSPVPALIPPLYLANHAPVPHAVGYGRVVGGAFRVRAFRAAAAGDAFLLGYGRLAPDHALLYYGFVPAPPDADAGVVVVVGGKAVTVRAAAASSRGALAAARRAVAGAAIDAGTACEWTGRGLSEAEEGEVRRTLAAAAAAEADALKRAGERAAGVEGDSPFAAAVAEWAVQGVRAAGVALQWLQEG